MAVSEACALWIEQRIEEELEEQKTTHKSLRAIGRDIAKEIEKYFEAKVAPETLRSKVRRIQGGSNDPPDANTENNSGKEGNQSPIKAPREHRATGEPKGGKRPGAGRKKIKKIEAEVMKNEQVIESTSAKGLASFLIVSLKKIPKHDPARIDELMEVFCWIKTIFKTEEINYDC